MIATKEVVIILIVAMTCISIAIIILKFFERRLKKKLIEVKNSRDNFYLSEIERMRNLPEKDGLKDLDKVSRDFFREALNIQENHEFSDLTKYFGQQQNKVAHDFCYEMTQSLYSGRQLSRENFLVLLNLFSVMVQGTHILSKAELEEAKMKEGKK